MIGGVDHHFFIQNARPKGPARGQLQPAGQITQICLSQRWVDSYAIRLHHVGLAFSVDEFVHNRTSIKKEDCATVNKTLLIRHGAGIIAQINSRDTTHEQTVEFAHHWLDDGDLGAKTIKHPITRAIEFDEQGTHIFGDLVSIERVP